MKIYNKYIMLFILAMSISCNLQAQEIFQTISMDTINVSFNPLNTQSVFLSNDGGYLITCQIDEWDPKLKKYIRNTNRISKYDVNGNRLWYKDFNDFWMSGLCELQDGSIVVCGNKLTMGTPDEFRTAYIVKLDPCGEVEWAKMDKANDYPGTDNLFTLRTLIDTGDGLLFPFRFDAEFYDPDNPMYTYDSRTDLLKLDYDGNVVYRTRFEQYGYSQEIWGGGIDSEGNIWMSGNCSAPHPYDPRYSLSSPLVVKCDSDGNLLYIKSAKDQEINSYDGGYIIYKNPLVSTDDTFFMIPPLTIKMPSHNDEDSYISSEIIKVDRDCNLTTHIIENNDHDPEYTNYMFGLDFIDGEEHLITSSRYICKDVGDRTKANKINLRQFADGWHHKYIKRGESRFLMDGATDRVQENKSGEDDYILSHKRNMICIVDRNGNMVDSLKMEGDYTQYERTENILTVENDNFLVVSVDMETPDYITRIRKFNRALEPAFIDHTPREYDTNCDRPIKSGLVLPDYQRLIYTNVVEPEINSIRLSPNPASDNVRVYLSNGFGEKQIDIYNTQGSLKKSIKIGEGWAQESIDVSDFPKGVYIVKLTAGGKLRGTEKLIVK